MRKIRIGNDFALLWKIRRGEQAEDLTEAQEMSLKLWVQGDHNSLKENIPFDIVGSDTVRVEVTPSIADKIGRYRLEFKYQFVNLSNADKNQKCAVDVEPFYIVPLTEIAETIDTVNCESDVLIGLRGRAFVYDDFTPEQIEDLKRPAVEAAESVQIVENQISINEQGRVQAENERETAELTRQSSESERNENEGLRVNAEGLRVTAESSRELTESLRVDAELLRQTNTQTAITNAENATENANTAAQNADNARLAIQDDLALKANHGYESNPKTLKQVDDEIADVESDVKETTEKPVAQSLSELNARITALEAIISNKIKDRIDVTKEFNVWGKTNLILYGDGASTKTPDFIGQTYIDTTNSNVYIAVGNSNAGNWKLV